MPYPGIEPGSETEKKMESCVAQVIAQGKSEESAHRICRTSLTGSFEDYTGLELTAATDQDLAELQLHVEASVPGNTILKFTGAKLAVAEINRNRDGITPDGIKQMASTIRLMPLTEEHEKEPRGIFTRGYVDESGLNCLVDGFIWSGHFPVFSAEVQSGKRKLSMDCDARFAVCGECGSVFTSTLEYCEHMRQHPREAVRWLHDLTAVAGGAVLHPAGTGTVFPGQDGFLVVSHSVVTAPEEPLETVSEDTTISAEGDDNMKVKCPKCEHEFNVSAQAEELQAKLDAALADLQAKSGLEAEVAALKAKLENEERVVTRFAEMAATAGIEVAQETLETLRVADQGVYETLKAMAGKIRPPAEPTRPAEPPVTVIAADESKPVSAGDQWTLEV